MTCRESRHLLNAYVDGELDSARSLEVESHIQACGPCLADVENLQGLASAIRNGALRFNASQKLKNKVLRQPERKTKPMWLNWRLAAVSLSVLLLVAVFGLITTRRAVSSDEAGLINDIVSSHVRSLMVSHLTDVASSDSHTVKPWFSGKLDYSPPAKDLTEQGFRLVGGRLDYLDHRSVAAVIYQRKQHFINLFVWPADPGETPAQDQQTRQGFNLIHWTDSGLTYWLISDINIAELSDCARLLKQ